MAIATVYAAYVIVLYFMRGAEAFTAHGTTLGAIVLSYYVGFATAGALVGVLLPAAKVLWVALVTGVLAAFCVIVAVVSAIEGPAPTWGAQTWFICASLAVMLGAPVSFLWWNGNRASGGV